MTNEPIPRFGATCLLMLQRRPFALPGFRRSNYFTKMDDVEVELSLWLPRYFSVLEKLLSIPIMRRLAGCCR